MKNDFSVIIIGAGVVGLSIARTFAKHNLSSVLMIEKEEDFGRGISSRNSEVIHSGIYYPKDSLKAKMCIKGRELLYDYCIQNKIKHNQCGKLLIAQKGQEVDLTALYQNAKTNPIPQLRIIGKDEIQSLEPSIQADSALFVGCTGIVDAHQLMSTLKRDSENAEHNYLFKSKFIQAKSLELGYEISIENASGIIEKTSADWIINASGLNSDIIAQGLGKSQKLNWPQLQYSKGEYFKLSSKWRNKFNHLVYPLPDKTHDSLGIHLSFDAMGNTKLGPSAHWMKNRQKDYAMDKTHLNHFFSEASRYIKGLEMDDLSPDFSGIRPKIASNDHSFSDFYISHENASGFPHWINLIGIDSPGLTSALAIGEHVGKMVL